MKSICNSSELRDGNGVAFGFKSQFVTHVILYTHLTYLIFITPSAFVLRFTTCWQALKSLAFGLGLIGRCSSCLFVGFFRAQDIHH